MFNKSLPVGMLVMVMVIMLALLGVGYAFWSETLTISGTVQTGELDVKFSTYPPEECVDIEGVGECQPEVVEGQYDKSAAANCSVQWLGPDGDGNNDPSDNGKDKMLVTVTGMYPSWHCKVKFDVTNIGNVPVHVKLPEASGDIPEWVAYDWENECYDDGVQLHQGESTGACTMDIHFTNAQAPQEGSGPHTFGWTILAHQYNEEPEIINVTSADLAFSSTGWGGWSCPVDHPYVVNATTNCVESLTQYLWEPGATTGSVNYPNTPFGYTYTPPEEGSIVQMGGTGETCNILLECSNAP